MNRNLRWLRSILDQKGLSLVEVLGAVTILSIVSVTLMGYFIHATEKSADESRRIIAANLAREKVVAIRNDLGETQKEFKDFVDATDLSNGTKTYDASSRPPFGYEEWVDPETVNGTTYKYVISFDDTSVRGGSRKAQLNYINIGNKEEDSANVTSMDERLLRMIVTVYWEGTDDSPLPAKSTAIDTYIVNRG